MPNVFVAPNATVVGRAAIAIRSSVWYGAVVRADLNTVTIGRCSAVQDRAVISTCKSVEGHVAAEAVIGNFVVIGAAGGARARARASPRSVRTIANPLPPPAAARSPAGPGALLQSCTIEDCASVGAGAIVLEGALVERGARVGDGAVVHPGRRIPAGQLWEGNPAVFVRDLTKQELAGAEANATAVADLAAEHAAEFMPFTTAYNDAEKLGVDALDKSLAEIKARVATA